MLPAQNLLSVQHLLISGNKANALAAGLSEDNVISFILEYDTYGSPYLGQNLFVRLAIPDFAATGNIPQQVLFDNIGLETSFNAIIVPEPSTSALAALVLLSLGLIGWRRRRT